MQSGHAGMACKANKVTVENFDKRTLLHSSKHFFLIFDYTSEKL